MKKRQRADHERSAFGTRPKCDIFCHFCYGIYLYKIFISIYIDIYSDRIFIEGILFLIALYALFRFLLTAELTSVLTLVC